MISLFTLFLLICVVCFLYWVVVEYFRRGKYFILLKKEDGRERVKWDKSSKVIIIGHTSSGKTTLSKFLSSNLRIEHVELDAIFWLEGWEGNKNIKSDFKEKMLSLKHSGWVVDGNYHKSLGMNHYKAANTLVYLDMPPLINWYRLIFRTVVMRLILRRRCCGNNVESFWNQFFSKESLFYYFYRRSSRSRFYDPKFYKKMELTHLNVYHLSSPYEVKLFRNEVLNEIKRRKRT